MTIQIVSLSPSNVPPLSISERIKSQLPYLADSSNTDSEKSNQATHEYLIDNSHAAKVLDDGVFLVVSPLRAENAAEVELSEEAEEFLEWVLANQVTHFAIR